jgi:hypothetical protein
LEKAGNPDGSRVVKEMRVIGPVEFDRATAKTAAEAAALGGKNYEVTLGADETMVDLVKLTGYRPPILKTGQGADRCGYVVCSVEAERAGRMTLFVANDWWGQLHVNGRLVGEKGGDWDVDTVKFPDLKRHVDEAHELGIYIAQTLPKKPKSPLQRYRLLRKGKDVLA